MKQVGTNMQSMWSSISATYWRVEDLEQKQRRKLADFFVDKKWKILEFACGNGKVLECIYKKNKWLSLSGIDYNPSMIKKAKEVLPEGIFCVADITKKDIGKDMYDAVFCINSLHNLPEKKMIYKALNSMCSKLKKNWYIILDIRNIFNPFIAYGYRKNRKKWLSFWTLNYFNVISYLKGLWFDVVTIEGIYYTNREESFFNSRFKILNFLYTLYLQITRVTFFSPYIFIVLQKK